MTLPVPDLHLLVGIYEGVGRWIDIAGDAKPYRVHQSVTFNGDELSVEYAHHFDKEGTATSGRFAFRRLGESLFEVKMAGNPAGHGYMFGSYFHFHLKVGEIFVQTSYEVTPSGLAVNGSSTSNSQGRYIAWHEALMRQPR